MTLPFLRSPPFPWVEPRVAAVSTPGTSQIANREAVRAMLRASRVGGEFWRADAANPWLGDAAGCAAPDDDAAIAAWADGRVAIDRAGATIADTVLDAAAWLRLESAAYRDPFTGAQTDIGAAIGTLAAWRERIVRNRAIGAAVGMAAWKRDAIAQFLWDGERSPPFVAADAALPAGRAVAVWPSRAPENFAARARAQGASPWIVEDGFLRSNGLGAECRPPMSVIVDRSGGVYFDPAAPSDLETILATATFDAALVARARRLRAAIVAARLCKYGVDRGAAPDLGVTGERRVVLAVGQVEGDLSVLRGGGGVDGNGAFLAKVRAREPDAFILYRPHPDVVAGLRDGRIADPVRLGLADRIVSGGSLLALVERADRIHVLSSLTGFEALLRGREVTVHGAPFYAGWGLTEDLGPALPRRGRALTLDELVAGALILAPDYRDPETELPCPPEVLVARLAKEDAPATTLLTGFRRFFGATRATLHAMRGAA